jgi:hypothetical protein
MVNILPLLMNIEVSVTPLDLSKPTKLKGLLFQCGVLNIGWITTVLQTVQSDHLQWITVHAYGTLVNLVEETVLQEWQELDCLLVQFWATHSIRPKIKYEVRKGQRLLPELVRRGLFDLVTSM